MSDNICGAECADGTPCQHPAGSCPVPSHSDPAAENPQGRDLAISEADEPAILEAARQGRSETGCARAAGVSSWAQLDRYLDANPEFRSAFTRARAQGESTLIDGGLHDDAVDTSMAKFLLASSFDYQKSEKREHEHSGEDGGPIEVAISETVVETDWDGADS